MKLWLISQTKNQNYDTFDSAVVAAETEDEARLIHPSRVGERQYAAEWTSVEYVSAEYLGEAKDGTKAGVICASFNAG